MSDLKKYLKLFNNHDGYEEFTGSTEYIKPNVSRCEEEKHVHYGKNCPTSITFAESAITVNINDMTELQFEPVIEPSDVKNKTLLWGSSNPNIATVDKNGLVTFKKLGRCTIWAKTIDTNQTARCLVYCTDVNPESIELNKNILYMESGNTYQLRATISPSKASQAVSWTSSNPTDVSVDSNGLVTALVLEGESIVTATSTDKPELTASCSVTVTYVKVSGVSVSESAVTVDKGETIQLEAIIDPENAAVKDVVWESSDPDVCTIDENGLLTGIEGGDSVITVTTVDQGLTATCNVHVMVVKFRGVYNGGREIKLECDGDTRLFNTETTPSGYEPSSMVEAHIGECVTDTFSAFTNCISLKNAIVPSNVRKMWGSDFRGCALLENCTIEEGVQEMGESIFFNCTSLKNIVIPNSVRRIDRYCFQSCDKLESVTIGSGATSIGGDCFWGCSSLSSCTLGNNVQTIGYECFIYCRSLANIVIPDSVTTIGLRAFSNCTSLTACTIGTGLTKIEEGLFVNCSSLESLTIPGNVKSTGSGSCANCTSLSSCTIENGFERIGTFAFAGCTALKNITLPSSVTRIEQYAFSNCTGLESITVEATTPPSIQSGVFNGTNDCPIYVPAESVEVYKTNWSTWADRIQPIS